MVKDPAQMIKALIASGDQAIVREGLLVGAVIRNSTPLRPIFEAGLLAEEASVVLETQPRCPYFWQLGLSLQKLGLDANRIRVAGPDSRSALPIWRYRRSFGLPWACGAEKRCSVVCSRTSQVFHSVVSRS